MESSKSHSDSTTTLSEKALSPHPSREETPTATPTPLVQVPVPELVATQRVDGGTRAWLQVAGSFCLFFSSWGFVNTFGVFQAYYENEILSATSPSNISWIGSLQAFLLVFVGVITGPVFDRGYLRTLLVTGTFLTVFGMMMTSVSKTYYQVLLAQGLCVGLGSGCLFVPSVAIVATYFTTKRAFATGVAVSGGSIGGIIYPITFRSLLPMIGFPWATRVLAFITLALLSVSMSVMKTRSTPKKSRSLLQPSAFKNIPYTLQTAGLLVAFLGLYFPIFYVEIYANQILKIDPNFSFYLLAILNASSVFGRVIPNFLADKLGVLNMLVACTFCAGLLCLCWIAIHDLAGIVVFCSFYGFFSGAFVSLFPAVVARLTPDMSMVGTWMGMSFAIGALGLLVGNPIAGALVNGTNGSFMHAQAFAGAIILAGAALIGGARVLRGRVVESWKI